MERRREKQWRGKRGNEVRNEKRGAKRSKVTWGKKEDGKWLRGKSDLTSGENDRNCKGRRGEEKERRGEGEERILVKAKKQWQRGDVLGEVESGPI